MIKPMYFFISYSRSDEVAVRALTRVFDTAHREVRLDLDLNGGEVWWDMVLRNIRESSVFVFAMSDHSLASKACLAELEYANALSRPILPVLVGPVTPTHTHGLTSFQHIVFRHDDSRTGFEVLSAADRAAQRSGPLPIPLPMEPAIPFAYLDTIHELIEKGDLDNRTQVRIVSELRRSLGEETDVSAQRDILKILRNMHDRPWLTVQAEFEIRVLLAAYATLERELAESSRKPATAPDQPKRRASAWTEEVAREVFLKRIEEIASRSQTAEVSRESKDLVRVTPSCDSAGHEDIDRTVQVARASEATTEEKVLRIFISYRRNDARHIAGRLFDRLIDKFGYGNVFMDVDSIEPGLDFTDAIRAEVARCHVLLALIGTAWLDSTDESGSRRIDDPDDLVVAEIKAALDRGIRVVPVLVDGAPLPRPNSLPSFLLPLSKRNAIRLDHETFRTDVSPLLATLDRLRRLN